MSFKDKLNEAEKSEHNSSGGGWFKFREGKNSIRVLTEPEPFFEDFKRGICYTGCGYSGSAKTLAYVLDNLDGKVKLMRIPYTISQLIASWQISEDWSFENFPMPYDIVIEAKGAGTKEVEYSPTPRPKRTEVSNDVIEQVLKQGTCAEVIAKLKEKNIEKHKADGSWQKEQERQAALKTDLENARTGKVGAGVSATPSEIEYPTEEINPEDIPF